MVFPYDPDCIVYCVIKHMVKECLKSEWLKIGKNCKDSKIF